MEQSKYRWDVERMEGMLRQLEVEYEEILSGRDFLETLTDEVQRDWDSVAGEQYRENLEIDMREYEAVLKQLKRHSDHLDRIIHDCYQECEKKVCARAAQMHEIVQRI